MIRSYIRTSLRNLWHRKASSAINVLGLTLGLTVFILLVQYAHFEWSYDQYHKNRDDLYRITLEQYLNGELLHASAENYPALGPAMVNDFPEVLSYSRLYNLGAKNNIVVTREDTPEKISFKHRKLLYASKDFLSMFSYEVIRGNHNQALAEPFKMVISEDYADRYFGDEDPIGKQLRMQDDDFNNELCEVTAVARIPENSHLKFDILISYSTLYARYDGSERARTRYDQSWERKDMYTYVQLVPGTDPSNLETKLPALIDRYMPDLAAQNRREVLHIQPVTDIHLYSNLNNEPEYNGNGRAVSFLSMIALFVLILAYINYINLATARSVERANEVGVRKVMGAKPGQLIWQFLLESFFVNLLAVLLAVGAYLLLLPAFTQLTGIFLDGYWEYLLIREPWFVLFLFALLMVGTLLSGLYPAFVLSKFKPIRILGKSMQSDKQGVWLRKTLVVMQFAICIALIIGTLTVVRQMQYLQEMDLGFNPSQILVVEQPSVFTDFESRTNHIRVFKNSLRQEAGISDVMSALVIPGQKVRWRSDIHRLGQSEDQAHIFNYNLIDEHFFTGFEMDIVAGRSFSTDIPSDRDTACIITESGVSLLGYASPEEAIGQVVQSGDGFSAIVVGVVNDYHQESLHTEVQPTIFFLNDYAEYYMMRISTDRINRDIAAIERNWNTHFPGNPFQYFFMDDHFNAQYENDLRFQKLILVFAVLSIILACLGLFGLSAYAAQQRLREISIRKVLGARIDQVVLLLTRDFTVLMLIGNLIAWPVIAFLMQRWLQGFAVRTSLSLWVFILSAGLVVLIGALTVMYHALRAATTNPSEVLAAE